MRGHVDVLTGKADVAFVRMVRVDIEDIRLGAHFRAQNRDTVAIENPGNFTFGIVEIAEDTSPAWTCVDAGRNHSLGNPMYTEVAFVGGSGYRIDKARVVRTGLHTVFTTDANVRIDNDDAVLRALIGRPGRADADALRLRALIAKTGQEAPADIRISSLLGVFNPGSGKA